MPITEADRRSEEPWLRLALLFGLLVGFVLRLYRLGAESLWYDETVSVFLAGKSLSDMIAHTAGDIHPPGYYGLLHGWRLVSQPSIAHGLEFLYAWPSLWAGMLIVALLYPLGRRLFNRPTAVLAVWLAAVNPFHLWYGQEVRMYTLGAMLGLLCLWALLRFLDRDRRSRLWLIVYVLSATAGLYTLYYFAFALIGLNGIAAVEIVRMHRRSDRTALHAAGWWIGAQIAVLLLWLPWLPIFLRQALDPPVPPWRAPWSSLEDILATLGETLGALVIGQTPPGGRMWPFAVMALLAMAFFFLASSRNADTDQRRLARTALALYLFVPMAALYLLTAFVTPLYHVRYVFIYAPVFLLMLAAAIVTLGRFGQPAIALALAVLVLLSGWGLREFWFNPLYRSDDHRGAVAELARNWRPGDVILVNAGWAYTALEVYWPDMPGAALAVAPPPIGINERFTIYASKNADSVATHRAGMAERPVIVLRTGVVDGDPSLGWGRPESDFYAVSSEETAAALDAIGSVHPRIWHYRLYDTVSDPNGLIRSWLEENATLVQDMPIPGRDYLRIQRYDTDANPNPDDADAVDVQFGNALRLVAQNAPSTARAGEFLYTDLFWSALPGMESLDANLSMSLRLYTPGSDQAIAQQDTAPVPPTQTWQPGRVIRQSLAVPVPASAEAQRYSLELIVYRQDTAEPLAPSGNEERIAVGQRWRLADVEVIVAP